jgi:hypothetical protein
MRLEITPLKPNTMPQTKTQPKESNAWSALFEINYEFKLLFEKIRDNTAGKHDYERFQKIIEVVSESAPQSGVFSNRKAAVRFMTNVQWFAYFMKKHGHQSLVEFYKKRRKLPFLVNSRVEEFMPYVISAGEDVLAYFKNMKIALEEQN